jgi:aldehyde dehydrogenase (NAD+)
VGGKIAHPEGAKGDFFEPTVLTGVTPSMRIWKEEVFGPVMLVVPFTDDVQAVSLANDCAFGLGSNVFSKNIRRANAIATQLQVPPPPPSQPLQNFK